MRRRFLRVKGTWFHEQSDKPENSRQIKNKTPTNGRNVTFVGVIANSLVFSPTHRGSPIRGAVADTREFRRRNGQLPTRWDITNTTGISPTQWAVTNTRGFRRHNGLLPIRGGYYQHVVALANMS